MASSSTLAVTRKSLSDTSISTNIQNTGSTNPGKNANQTQPQWVAKNPWRNINTSPAQPTTRLEEVMSEQLAMELQIQNNVKLDRLPHEVDSDAAEQSTSEKSDSVQSMVCPDTSNDALLAQMLQTEMDKEYNQYLSHQEKQVNKNSKVKVSFRNYRTDEMFLSDNDDESEEEDNTNNDNSDPFTGILDIKNDKGYVVFGNEVVTKHDGELCGRRNTARLEDSFPVQFPTGDATGMDILLNNKIYNSLRTHAYSEQKRSHRLHETKEHYTAEHAVDEKTRLILHRFIDRSIIASVNGVISVGKEAVVIHADGGDVIADSLLQSSNAGNNDISCIQIPKECAIKVFKTTLNEFRTRDKYIKDDYRFKDRFKKLNPRKIIHMWAEKEMHNLVRMNKAGICCPEVVLLKKHVLVMSFIGQDQQPAPKLKTALLSSSEKLLAYQQVLDMMTTLYKQCNLVHADLSEFNLLWFDRKVWMIDVSQSVEPSHPRGLEFLLRDCTNISKFFTNLGVPDVLNRFELFNEVSGLDIPADDHVSFLETIKKMESCSEEHAQQGKKKSSQILEEAATDD